MESLNIRQANYKRSLFGGRITPYRMVFAGKKYTIKMIIFSNIFYCMKVSR